MKIKKPQNKPAKITIIILVTLLVASGAYFAYAAVNNTWPFAPQTTEQDPAKIGGSSYADYTPPTEEQTDAGLQAKEESVREEQPSPDPEPSESPKKVVSVIIDSANVNSKDQVDIRTSIATRDDKGTCTLTLTKPGAKTITKTASTQIITSYSACSGFLIPASQLAKGKWTAEIKYEGEKAKGSASSPVTIE